MKRLLLLIAILLSIAGFAQGQQKNYISYQLTIEDGLPSNAITALAQDNDGFIWIATANGLCRYDGYNMLTLKNMAPGKKKVPDRHVAYMDYDRSKSQLLITTTDKSQSVYDTDKARMVSYTSGSFMRTYPFDAFQMAYKGIRFTDVSSRGIVGKYRYVADNDGNFYLFYPPCMQKPQSFI